jgi:TetR/AcrR family transcriptional regulator, transcriptional repressor for nem operon
LRIIRTAAGLFHKQGVGATSPDEILEASRSGKGQFYHYFGSKEGLVHAVLQSYIKGVETGTSLINYEVGSWEDLERRFASHIELQKISHDEGLSIWNWRQWSDGQGRTHPARPQPYLRDREE